MPPDQLDIYAVDVAAELSCLDHDPELFFAADPSDVEAAKLICRTCPLMQECLDGALRRAEPHGVWGGQLIVDGVIVAQASAARARTDPLVGHAAGRPHLRV